MYVCFDCAYFFQEPCLFLNRCQLLLTGLYFALSHPARQTNKGLSLNCLRPSFCMVRIHNNLFICLFVCVCVLLFVQIKRLWTVTDLFEIGTFCPRAVWKLEVLNKYSVYLTFSV